MTVSVLVLLVSCGGNVTSEAKIYLGFIATGEFEQAYEELSPRLQESLDFDIFSDYMINPDNNESVADSGIAFTITGERIFPDGKTASAYGTLSMEGATQNFRIPMSFDEDRWWVNDVVVEQEDLEYPGYYVSLRLRGVALDFFDLMLDGKIDEMWEQTSNRIHEEMTIEDYSELTISTVSGKTPREEEYTIMIGAAYSNEPEFKNRETIMSGFAFVTIILGNPETSETTANTRADFVFEDGIWKADFAKLEATEE